MHSYSGKNTEWKGSEEMVISMYILAHVCFGTVLAIPVCFGKGWAIVVDLVHDWQNAAVIGRDEKCLER